MSKITNVTEKPKRVVKRITSVVELKTSTISRTNALDLMKNTKGTFFTAVFIDKKGSERTMNCQYLKDQGVSELGYVKVREMVKLKMSSPEEAIRNINLQTINTLKISGKVFKIK